MNPLDDLEQAIQDTQYKTSPTLDDRILSAASAAMAAAQERGTGKTRGGLWRPFMKSNYAKLATAAAIVIVPACLWLALQGGAKQTYALQQTIQANRSLRSIHLRVQGGGFDEAWAELDENGTLLRVRMNFPQTEDGPKEVVCQDGKADVWFKAKNGYTTLREPDAVAKFSGFYRVFDPITVTNELDARQASGKDNIDIQQPPQAGAPVIVTATSATGERRDIYRINATSKLVDRVERYRREGQDYVLQSSWDYLEYNQPLAADAFVMNPPADVNRVDETTQVIGLPKGDLTDAQITLQVSKEFFEAMIAKDYTKAGQMLGGLPAKGVQEVIEKHFGKVNFLRIVSWGEPKPAPPEVTGMHVDCVMEVEVNGVKKTQTFEPAVRPVYSQRERWALHGL